MKYAIKKKHSKYVNADESNRMQQPIANNKEQSIQTTVMENKALDETSN